MTAEIDKAALEKDSAIMGLLLSDTALLKICAFAQLLQKWNQVYNLSALKSAEDIYRRHILDSLSILPFVDERNLLDVGSGGGLPGLVIAIARPDLPITLIDAVHKKCAFLQQATIDLQLKNVSVVHGRVEKFSGQFGQIVSRAFANLADFALITRHLLADQGVWLAMKGVLPASEIQDLPKTVRVVKVEPLFVPETLATRHLIILDLHEIQGSQKQNPAEQIIKKNTA